MSSKKETKFVPIRGMADFVSDSTRYIAPTFSDLKRFNNRVTSNLLYYQTNYFLVTALVFSLYAFCGFNKILVGSLGIGSSVANAFFVLDKVPQLSSLKSQYPMSVYAVGAVNLLVVYLTFRYILYVGLATLVPIAICLCHASVRSRGIKNRINNKMEQIGAAVYTNSPMGILLSTLGIETKDSEE